jgi:hypothetical protein
VELANASLQGASPSIRALTQPLYVTISRLTAKLAAHKTFLLLSADLAVDLQLLPYPGEDGDDETAGMDKLSLITKIHYCSGHWGMEFET